MRILRALLPAIGISALFAFGAAAEAPDGEALFAKTWGAEEGLGPLFNARSCFSCHVSGGRGRPTDGSSELSPTTTVHAIIAAQCEGERSFAVKGGPCLHRPDLVCPLQVEMKI